MACKDSSLNFQSWGGRDNGFGLADCCKDLPISVSIKVQLLYCHFYLIFNFLHSKFFLQHFPPSATTLHFEFYAEDTSPTSSTVPGGATAAPTATISGANPPATSKPKGTSNPTSVIHIQNIDTFDKTPAQMMDQLLATYAVPKDKQACNLCKLCFGSIS